MSQIINFVNRSNIATTNNKSQQVDAIKIIEYFSSLHPLNRVKPNSLLYETAVNQYNQNIKNTLIRPTVPSWFCGKINPETGDLINNPSDESLRATAGVVLDPLTLQPTISGDTLSGYVVDTCLILGTPGSYDYTKCAEGRDAAEVAELVSDWLTGMESVGGLEEFATEGEGKGVKGSKESGVGSSGGKDLALLAGIVGAMGTAETLSILAAGGSLTTVVGALATTPAIVVGGGLVAGLAIAQSSKENQILSILSPQFAAPIVATNKIWGSIKKYF